MKETLIKEPTAVVTEAEPAAPSETLSIDDVIRMKQHGVTPDFIRDLRRVGYPQLLVDDIIRLRRHGIEVEFIMTLRYLGFEDLTVEELVRLKNHGVTPEYIEELKALGYGLSGGSTGGSDL